jgi:hypothetical protein
LPIEDDVLRSENPQSAIANPKSNGRPYFVMELVRGVPITEFCNQHRYTPLERGGYERVFARGGG